MLNVFLALINLYLEDSQKYYLNSFEISKCDCTFQWQISFTLFSISTPFIIAVVTSDWLDRFCRWYGKLHLDKLRDSFIVENKYCLNINILYFLHTWGDELQGFLVGKLFAATVVYRGFSWGLWIHYLWQSIQ